jgi:hypothetical protein
MPILPLGALSAPSKIQSSDITSTSQTHHKRGAQALEGDFATVASNALSTVGQAHVAVSGIAQTVLSALKPSS